MTKHECRSCKGAGKIKYYDWPSNPPRPPSAPVTCYECKGAGEVEVDGCYHDWKWVEKLGRCYNKYQCTICNRTKSIDSGD